MTKCVASYSDRPRSRALADLVQRIFERLSPGSLVPLSHASEDSICRDNFCRVRETYVRWKVLHNLLKDLAISSRKRSDHHLVSSDQIFNKLGKRLVLSQLSYDVPSNNCITSSGQLFGLTREDFQVFGENSSYSLHNADLVLVGDSINRKLRNVLDRIRGRLVRQQDAQTTIKDEDLVSMVADLVTHKQSLDSVKLCELLQSVAECDSSVLSDQKGVLIGRMQKAIRRPFGDLSNLSLTYTYVDQLTNLVMDHRLSKQAALDDATVKYVSMKSETLDAKLKCLRLEIEGATYSKSACTALRIIFSYLQDELNSTNVRCNNLAIQLKQYAMLGPEMQAVIDAYVQVQVELADKRWSLEQLDVQAVSATHTN